METLMPEGRYRMAYIKHEDGNAYGRRVWFVWFQIMEPGEYEGLLILRFYNQPAGGRLARSSSLAMDFMALTGLRPPANLSPDYFLKGCEVLGRVVSVTERVDGARRIQRPEELHYSKVAELLKITACSPPCLQGRASEGRRTSPATRPITRTSTAT